MVCHWEGRAYTEYHLIIRPEGVAVILYKNGICDVGQTYMSQMARVFSKLASPHQASVVSLGRQTIHRVPFNIKTRHCRSYPVQKWNLWFWAKCMFQIARVLSKLASPHEARVVSLGRQNISGVPLNIKAKRCRIYPVQKWNLWFWAKICVSNSESVLEAGKSTWGEGGVVRKVEPNRSTI